MTESNVSAERLQEMLTSIPRYEDGTIASSAYICRVPAPDLEAIITLALEALALRTPSDETAAFVNAVQLVEDAGWVVLRPEQVRTPSDGEVDKLRETMWAEVIYEGEDNSFRFELNEEGNRDGPHYDRSIEFAAETFPAGTKIIVYEPDEEAALTPGKE